MLKLGPLRLHWSLVLGAVLFCAAEPRPLLLAGYGAVLFAHVLGHLLAISGTSSRISGVMVHGLGGELLGEGETTPLRRSVVALAGVLAQLALLLGALAARRHLPADLADALVRRNGIVLLLNLVPLRPLDGAQAWRIFSRLRARARARRLRRPIAVREVPISREVRQDVAELIGKIRDSTKVR